MFIQILSLMSSIATILLFFFYVIGRIMTVFLLKNVFYDKFESVPDEKLTDYKIVDECNLLNENLQNYHENIVITAETLIRNLKVYTCHYNEKKKKLEKIDLVYNYELINKDESVLLLGYLAECMPSYIVEYDTYSYMKMSFTLSDNLKSGIISVGLKPKHTFKSFWYYFTK